MFCLYLKIFQMDMKFFQIFSFLFLCENFLYAYGIVSISKFFFFHLKTFHIHLENLQINSWSIFAIFPNRYGDFPNRFKTFSYTIQVYFNNLYLYNQITKIQKWSSVWRFPPNNLLLDMSERFLGTGASIDFTFPWLTANELTCCARRQSA